VGERVASWFAVVLMLAVLITSYWYARSLREPVATDAGRIGAVDFFADGIALTGFDALGRPHYRLFAERMTHFANSDDIDLVKPRLLSMRPDQPLVEATALSAHAQNNAQTVQLYGDVLVTRAGDGKRAPLLLQTDALTAVPDDDHFWSEAPVRLQSGATVMSARRMDLDNIARRLRLDGAVVGMFAPRVRR